MSNNTNSASSIQLRYVYGKYDSFRMQIEVAKKNILLAPVPGEAASHKALVPPTRACQKLALTASPEAVMWVSLLGELDPNINQQILKMENLPSPIVGYETVNVHMLAFIRTNGVIKTLKMLKSHRDFYIGNSWRQLTLNGLAGVFKPKKRVRSIEDLKKEIHLALILAKANIDYELNIPNQLQKDKWREYDIRVIKTEHELQILGLNEKTCIGGYGPRIQQGTDIVFTLTDSREKITCCIKKDEEDHWILDEAKLTCNEIPRIDLLQLIAAELTDNPSIIGRTELPPDIEQEVEEIPHEPVIESRDVLQVPIPNWVVEEEYIYEEEEWEEEYIYEEYIYEEEDE